MNKSKEIEIHKEKMEHKRRVIIFCPNPKNILGIYKDGQPKPKKPGQARG